MAISEELSSGKREGDLILHVEHPAHCYVSGKLVGAAGQASVDANLLGQPVKASGANYIFVLAADAANALGVLATAERITLAAAAVSDRPYKILIRGPALIDKDALPAADVVGGAITNATLVTAFAARDITSLAEPTKVNTQTS